MIQWFLIATNLATCCHSWRSWRAIRLVLFIFQCCLSFFHRSYQGILKNAKPQNWHIFSNKSFVPNKYIKIFHKYQEIVLFSLSGPVFSYVVRFPEFCLNVFFYNQHNLQYSLASSIKNALFQLRNLPFRSNFSH